MPTELAFGLTPRAAAVIVGAGLGLAFGVLAQRTRFCLRRAVAGPVRERQAALGVWAMALAVALAGTTIVLMSGLVDLSGHRLFSGRLPVVAIVLGGLLFGTGMVLARGCASRLTVLAGTGNLRALTVMLVFALVAHATLKGALAPIRTTFGAVAVDLGAYSSLAALPGGAPLWAGIAIAVLLGLVVRSGARVSDLLGGALIGALAPLGWLATGWLLADEFDPVPVESIALTSAGADTLFWWVASSAIQPTFGVGFLAGIVSGSALAALIAREWKVVGFTEEVSTGRYIAGGALMGFGGVLAGGCTIGAGLAGASTLSIAAILALASIIAGAVLARELMAASRTGGPSLIEAASAGAVFIP
ncbi:MAG: YeeE/YedE family protein [Hyphomicrobiaceae bacterium]